MDARQRGVRREPDLSRLGPADVADAAVVVGDGRRHGRRQLKRDAAASSSQGKPDRTIQISKGKMICFHFEDKRTVTRRRSPSGQSGLEAEPSGTIESLAWCEKADTREKRIVSCVVPWVMVGFQYAV